jgi:hypothetical protein
VSSSSSPVSMTYSIAACDHTSPVLISMRPPTLRGVALEDAGQLLEIDGQGARHRCRSAAELGLKLVGQLIIPLPAPLPQTDHQIPGQLGGSVHALHDGRDEAVASQLQRIIIGADAAEQLDDSPPVTTIYRRPQGAAPLH